MITTTSMRERGKCIHYTERIKHNGFARDATSVSFPPTSD